MYIASIVKHFFNWLIHTEISYNVLHFTDTASQQKVFPHFHIASRTVMAYKKEFKRTFQYSPFHIRKPFSKGMLIFWMKRMREEDDKAKFWWWLAMEEKEENHTRRKSANKHAFSTFSPRFLFPLKVKTFSPKLSPFFLWSLSDENRKKVTRKAEKSMKRNEGSQYTTQCVHKFH